MRGCRICSSARFFSGSANTMARSARAVQVPVGGIDISAPKVSVMSARASGSSIGQLTAARSASKNVAPRQQAPAAGQKADLPVAIAAGDPDHRHYFLYIGTSGRSGGCDVALRLFLLFGLIDRLAAGIDQARGDEDDQIALEMLLGVACGRAGRRAGCRRGSASCLRSSARPRASSRRARPSGRPRR